MLVVIADSHVVHGDAQESSFFAMLERLSATPHDILFLGDNLDLWIASSPRYENESHARFLSWCRREKERRQVVLVEGNHEFYVCRHHGECFSACTESVYRLGGLTFVHGDMVQRRFGFHRCFRCFAKNCFGDFVMSWLPFGVGFAGFMKRLLCHKGGRARDFLPLPLIHAWMTAEHRLTGNRHGFMGHFHCGGFCEERGQWDCTILPAWKYGQRIGLVDESTGACRIVDWREAFPEGEASCARN